MHENWHHYGPILIKRLTGPQWPIQKILKMLWDHVGQHAGTCSQRTTVERAKMRPICTFQSKNWHHYGSLLLRMFWIDHCGPVNVSDIVGLCAGTCSHTTTVERIGTRPMCTSQRRNWHCYGLLLLRIFGLIIVGL